MKGRIKRLIIEFIANYQKDSFKRYLNSNVIAAGKNTIPIQIVSFSGEAQVADQLLSIFSFQQNVGTPSNWLIFSDGTHTQESLNIFKKIPYIKVSENNDHLIPDTFRQTGNPLIKKIFFYKSVPVRQTTLFTDSDIIFYKSFGKYIPELSSDNWFLVDEKFGYFDSIYLAENKFSMYPCNSGLLVFNKQPDWNVVLDHLDDLENKIEHWTEQTAFHILTQKDKSFFPLDPRYFIVGGKDAFTLSFEHDPNKIALRHFVGPVRHKMWQYSWKKILDLK